MSILRQNMERSMGTIFTILWFPGFIIAWVQVYRRAGFPDIKQREGIDWREFLIPNIPWFVMTVFKVWFWFVPFGLWLAQGRPGSPWRAVTEVNGRPARRIIRVASAHR
jgi:hypothetical protein